MSKKLSITQNFSVPFGFDFMQEHVELNENLCELFNNWKEHPEKYENKILTQAKKEGLFESQFNLFETENLIVTRLKNFMLDSIRQFVGKVNGYPDNIIKDLKIHCHSWFHITTHMGYFTAHNHPMASWSAVYCVKNEQSVDDARKKDSGVLRFFSPNANSNYYVDAGNANLSGAFTQSSLNFILGPGQMVIFPSYLFHEVSPYLHQGQRITVAINCWFESSFVKVRV